MSDRLKIIRQEIDNDPDSRGYKSMKSNAEIADDMNAPRSGTTDKDVNARRLLSILLPVWPTDVSEAICLQTILSIEQGVVPLSSARVRSKLRDIVTDPQARTQIAALSSRPSKSWAESNGIKVAEGTVEQARAL